MEQIGLDMTRILKAHDRSIFEISPNFTVVKLLFEEAFVTQFGKINGKINDKINSLYDILKYDRTATKSDLIEVVGNS